MKKHMQPILALLTLSMLHAQTVQNSAPDILAGLWENEERLVYFPSQVNTPLCVVLKMFYGHYYDRAAEPQIDAKESEKPVNNTTKPVPEILDSQYRQLSGVDAWDVIVRYNKDTVVHVPIAVIDNKLYLNFAVRFNDKTVYDAKSLDGFWMQSAKTNGVLIAPQAEPEDIWPFYVSGSDVYYIRYWKTDMKRDDSAAELLCNGKLVELPRHIEAAGGVYTCAIGHRKQIRDADIKKMAFVPSDYVLNKTGQVCVCGKPYLFRSQHGDTFESLVNAVAEVNSKRETVSPPLFPPNDVDWHYDDIRRLEAYNPVIQAVRARQKEFAKTLEKK